MWFTTGNFGQCRNQPVGVPILCGEYHLSLCVSCEVCGASPRTLHNLPFEGVRESGSKLRNESHSEPGTPSDKIVLVNVSTNQQN